MNNFTAILGAEYVMGETTTDDMALVKELTDQALENPVDLVKLIRTGIDPKRLWAVIEDNDLTALWKSGHQHETLSPQQSEFSVRVLRIFATAKDVLGDDEKARRWMTTSNAALGDNAPIDLLDTGFGYETVVDVLRRIEFGVFS